MSLPVMKIHLPGTIESDQGVVVILDDGRKVHIWPDGSISVYAREDQCGNADYELDLPSVEYVQTNCSDREDVTHNGHVMIRVEHRH